MDFNNHVYIYIYIINIYIERTTITRFIGIFCCEGTPSQQVVAAIHVVHCHV